MESTRNVISNCGEAINQIVLCLSAIESIEPELIEEGTQLVKSATEAMTLFTKGLSINQSSSDPPGSIWWEGRLGNFIFNVLRLTRNMSPLYEPIRQMMDNFDFEFVDQIRKIGQSNEHMEIRQNGPASVVKLIYKEAIVSNYKEKEYILCPAEDCTGRYGTEKAFNFHLKTKHPEDISTYSLPKECR